MKPQLPHCSEEHDYSCESPSLHFADGGRYLRVSFKLSQAAQWNAEQFCGRSETRGKCKGFSFGSRRRMLDRLNCVSVAAKLPAFVTATLPDDVFHDVASEFAKRAKIWMDAFVKRLRRRVPGASGFWRIEWQSRKSGQHEGKLFPHFHLLVWGLPERLLGEAEIKHEGQVVGHREVWEHYVPTPDNQLSLDLLTLMATRPKGSTEAEQRDNTTRLTISAAGSLPEMTFEGKGKFIRRCESLHQRLWVASVDEVAADRVRNMSFQDWASLAWYHVVASHNTDHLSAGVRVERVRSWGGVMSYAAKYMAKADCEFLSEVEFGRSWGIFNREALPWAQMVHLDLDTDVGVRIRRIARRYLQKRTGRKRRCAYGLTLYCDVAQFRKLWERPPPDPF